MGIKIGAGWTKNTQEKKTFISFSLDDEFLEIFPQFKNLRLAAFYVSEDKRKNENSPGWDLILFKPEAKEYTDELKDLI